MRGKLWFGVASAALLMSFAPAAIAQVADAPGDATTTATFTGAAIDAEINPAGDVDWYRMRVEQGQRYSITLEGLPNAEGQALDPMLAIHDADTNQLAFNDDANGLNSALMFSPAQSGVVFIEARAFSEAATGAYRLSATSAPLPADDVGNDTSTRARINSGRAVNGALEYEGDTDWYRLSARTGQRYRITLAGAGDSPLGDPFLRVLDADGNELAMSDDDGESLNSGLDFIPRSNGDVFIVASGYADAYTGTYALNVTASRAPTDSVSGTTSTRGRINLDSSVNGSIDFPGDTDWHRVRLTAGESYRFTLVSSGDAPLGDPLLAIYDARGEQVGLDDDGGEGLNSYLEFTAATTGNYFVEARAFSEADSGGYTLSARRGEIPADASTDAALSADGDYREGQLSPAGDRDWYRLELTEGQALRIGVDSSQTVDALGDPYVILYGPDGAEVARDDDGGEGLNAFLEYQATATGAHFIEVRGFSDDAEGRYVVSTIPGEIGNSADSADFLTVGPEGRQSQLGTADDVDWFYMETIEGRPYRIMLDGAGERPLADPYLTLYNLEGTQIAADDDGGTGLNSYLNFNSPTGGGVFVVVSSYGSASAGQYWLRVTDTDVPGVIHNTDETLDANSDSRISRIELPGDLDSYRVMLEANVRYVIDVRGHGDYALADPFLRILDGQGESVATDDDSGANLDARLRFSSPTGGEFYIQASGLGGSTGDYQVEIVRQ